jgi:hypothetical protein
LLEKSMARERDLRFQSAAELSAALELWLGGSAQGVLSPLSRGSAVPWSGDMTVESPKTPTSSNFGRTNASTSPFGAKGRRALVLAAVGAGLVVLVGVAVAFTRQGGPEPAASGVASVPSHAIATEAEVSAVAPAPEPVVAPVDAPLAEPSPPLPTSVPERPASVAPARRSTPAVQPRTKSTAQAKAQNTQASPAPAPAPAPAPTPTPTSRGRRDFGY